MTYTRIFQDQVPLFKTLRQRSTSAPWSTLYNTKFSVTLTGSRTGEKCLDWREKIRYGNSATTAFTSDRNSLTGREGFVRSVGVQLTPPPSGHPYSAYYEEFRGFSPTEYSNLSHLSTSAVKADAIALPQVYKKLEAELQHLNSSAILAEISGVVRQFSRPAAAIVDLTNKHLNRLDFENRRLKGPLAVRVANWARIVSSTYLEYAFGLAPLISDTRGVAEALAKFEHEQGSDPKLKSRIVARGTDTASSSSVTHQSPPSAWFVETVTVKTVTECRVQYVCGLGALPVADYGSNSRLLQVLGFNPNNWIPAIWEAVPWSWLVDYFSNVSQILQASVTSTASVKWFAKTVTYRSVRSTMGIVDPALSKQRLEAYNIRGRSSGTTGSLTRVRTTMTRTVPTSLGLPSLTLELPSELGQLANMTAVLFSRRDPSGASLHRNPG
jgi:hypothetical protein